MRRQLFSYTSTTLSGYWRLLSRYSLTIMLGCLACLYHYNSYSLSLPLSLSLSLSLSLLSTPGKSQPHNSPCSILWHVYQCCWLSWYEVCHELNFLYTMSCILENRLPYITSYYNVLPLPLSPLPPVFSIVQFKDKIFLQLPASLD